ncbi:50S ribosomal protein L21 [Caminibacter mediatlanticus TB-2]|uniref:Large ribosomal subunit protein bL21 n=1 Tax=Caminibacter mediatlanticus TB-2 TaxID=391592 RepID=A0AAI9F2E0_9BACT|nr:50S ribosomal protein L21 [Caminibacter mediatlanticus]EDM23496.1 50S ribosomal protein L21 [Caminibacter mediatlanticus TB-2]QCT94069.1 50S ribosomal protein L21 [Caminibacter mediatlanticus TB-2]
MYAVIKHGGKQYKVNVGDVLDLDRIEGVEPKQTIEINEVLLVNNDNDTKIGTPLVDGAKVVLEVIGNYRGKKVIIFKKRRRKDSKKKRGFRRDYTKVRVKEIVA